MKIHGYDEQTAERLLPLLGSIVGEIRERREEIKGLLLRLRALTKLGDEGRERHDVQARLSVHRRELRFSRKELEALGCELDPALPSLVHIRGESGGLQDGFTWVVDAPTLYDGSLRMAG